MPKQTTPEEYAQQLPFDKPTLAFAKKLTKPMFSYFTPEFYGLEHVDPTKPTLFVTNHTVFGLFDGPLFGVELYEKKGIFVRALVDNFHYEVPIWRDLLTSLGGAVKGTRKNCAELMRQQEHILVFPGGGREICKQKGEKYKLTWKSRMGFAHMAIEHGYQIIPIAGIGGDDTYNILIDSNEVMKSKLGEFLKKSGLAQKFLKSGEHIPPLVRGIGPTLIPKPAKFYYAFGKPIDTSRFAGQEDDVVAQRTIRREVEESMYAMFNDLLEKAKEDYPKLNPVRRWLNSL
ncbi:lysophospholipid acyltransferase family protein [soil metagenome]